MASVEVGRKRNPAGPVEPERDLLAEAVALAAAPLPDDPGPPSALERLALRLGVEPTVDDQTISLRASGDRWYALVDILNAFLDRIEADG